MRNYFIFFLIITFYPINKLNAQSYSDPLGILNAPPADKSDKIYNGKEVDKMPTYPYSAENMNAFIIKNFVYPDNAKTSGQIIGRISLHFEVTKNGLIRDIVITNDIPESLKKETIRVIRAMPRWIPAEKEGKRVNCIYYLPIIIDPN